MAESHVVLSVKVIPDIQHAVLSRDEEHALSSRAPAARSEVCGVVLGSHDWGFEVLAPDTCGPVAHRHEVLGVGGVTLDRVDGGMMFARRLHALSELGETQNAESEYENDSGMQTDSHINAVVFHA